MIDGIFRKGDRRILNNQQFRDHRGWNIGLGVCDRWEIGQGLYKKYQLSEIFLSQGVGDWCGIL